MACKTMPLICVIASIDFILHDDCDDFEERFFFFFFFNFNRVVIEQIFVQFFFFNRSDNYSTRYIILSLFTQQQTRFSKTLTSLIATRSTHVSHMREQQRSIEDV